MCEQVVTHKYNLRVGQKIAQKKKQETH